MIIDGLRQMSLIWRWKKSFDSEGFILTTLTTLSVDIYEATQMLSQDMNNIDVQHASKLEPDIRHTDWLMSMLDY